MKKTPFIWKRYRPAAGGYGYRCHGPADGYIAVVKHGHGTWLATDGDKTKDGFETATAAKSWARDNFKK